MQPSQALFSYPKVPLPRVAEAGEHAEGEARREAMRKHRRPKPRPLKQHPRLQVLAAEQTVALVAQVPLRRPFRLIAAFSWISNPPLTP